MKLLMIMLFSVLLSGCAINRAYEVIDYNQPLCAGKIELANAVQVEVDVTDLRENKAVGCKKNGYGMDMAYIISINDISEVIRNALVAELKECGFEISEGDKKVEIHLHKFYNDYKLAFFNNKACSESIVNVLVKNKYGKIIYCKTILGLGEEKNCYFLGGNNARLSLNCALSDTIHKIMGDPTFIEALLE